MLFNIQKAIDWKAITERKRKQITKDNKRENAVRIPHQYQVGDEVLRIKKGVKRKFSSSKSMPYSVEEVHTNGVVTIMRDNKRQKISIRNIEPYHT